MAGAVFKIYSGVHLGAVLELKEGTWVIGSDDSADIVLADASVEARHAAFDVTDNGVTETALDGLVCVAGGEEAVPETIEAGLLFRLGDVTLAWGPLSADPTFWKEVDEKFLALIRPVARTEAVAEPEVALPAAEGPGQKPEAAKDGGLPTDAVLPADPQTESVELGSLPDRLHRSIEKRIENFEAKSADEKRRTVFKVSALAAALVVLLLPLTSNTVDSALSTLAAKNETGLFNRSYNTLYHSSPAEGMRNTFVRAGINQSIPGPTPQKLREVLLTEGFAHIEVKRAPTGAYHCKGTVADDKERVELLAFAQHLPWPVVLDVAVVSDLVDAYRSAFNALGYWVDVTLDHTQTGTNVVVSGYIASSLEEERAFADVAETLPLTSLFTDRDRVRIERRIIHRHELEKVIADVKSEVDIDAFTLKWAAGSLTIESAMTASQKDRLVKARDLIVRKAGVPVKIYLADVAPQQTGEGTDAQSSSVDSHLSGPSFRVKAVSGGALRFVTLANGDKVFVGGMLPGGYRLIAVESEELILQKDNKRIVFPLRIKQK